MIDDKKALRGGKRIGSGRKKIENKKQRITFTLSADVIDFLKSHPPASRTLEAAVKKYAEQLELAENS